MERFTVLDRIGEGTFGEVLKAKDLQLGRIVALKRVRLRDVDAGAAPRRVAAPAQLSGAPLQASRTTFRARFTRLGFWSIRT